MFINGRFHVRTIAETEHDMLHYQIVFSFRDGSVMTDSDPIIATLFKQQADEICSRLNKALQNNE